MASAPERIRRIRLSITPEGWVYFVVLAFVMIGAILRNVNLLIVLAGMMLAPALLGWRAGMPMLRSLKLRRIVPLRSHAGQMLNFQWECTNRRKNLAAWNVVVADQIHRDDVVDCAAPAPKRRSPVATALITFPQIGVKSSEYASYRCLFPQRGKYVLGPTLVYSRFPFGLMRRWFTLDSPQTIFIAPRLGQLSPTWERRMQSTAVGSEAKKRQRGLEEEEFYALRPWRSGDSLRQVHWRSTAKHGHPMVKQFDQRSNRDFAMVLDLYLPVESVPQDANFYAARTETVISFAATVLTRLQGLVQGQIGVGICGQQTQCMSDRANPELIGQLMRHLAVAKPFGQTDLATACQQLIQAVSVGTPIYVISTRSKPQATSDWLPGISADRLRKLLPALRWLSVDAPEFVQMYQQDATFDFNTLHSKHQEFLRHDTC